MFTEHLIFDIAIALNIAMMIYWLFFHESRGYNFPFWAGSIAIAMILPQGIALLHNPGWYPRGGFSLTFIFISLCTIAIWLGYRNGLRSAVQRKYLSDKIWNKETLLRCGYIFTILGVGFYTSLSFITIELDQYNGNWTGTATILYFFAGYMKIGMVIGLFLALKYRSKHGWIIFAVIMMTVLPLIFFKGRRGMTMEVLAALLFLPFFIRHKKLPRWCFVFFAIAMSLQLAATSQFRSIILDTKRKDTYQERLQKIKWLDAWSGVTESGGGRETLNCVYGIYASHYAMDFDFGATLWNQIVWHYIPGQIIGRDVKRSLYIGSSSIYNFVQEKFPKYTAFVGSMWMGYTDAFQSFGWFGCILFFAIARIMGQLHHAASNGENSAVILYAWGFNQALHAIPSSSWDFFVKAILYFFIFIIPFLYVFHRSERVSLVKS